MKAVGYKVPGPIAENASLVDIDLPRPVAAGHDILVEVMAVSVNPVDYKVRGSSPPADGDWKVLGWDAAGIVREVGSDVTQFNAGDEVYQRSLEEARQRMVATLLGAAMALLLLFCFTIVGNLSVMVLLLFLAGLYFGTRMMTGREPPMVYQFGFSAMLALVGGSLTSSEPGYAVLTRVVLTLAGAMAAVLLTALLEALFVPEVARRTSHGQTGQTLGQP